MTMPDPLSRAAAAAALAAALALPNGAHAQSPQQAAIPITTTANTAPPSLDFTWPLDPTATNYSVLRRVAGTSSWGSTIGIPGGGTATGWSDTTALPGVRYEYYFYRNGSPVGRTFLTAGIEATALEDRGIVVLLVDNTHSAALAARLDRLMADLVGDGWRVLRHDVARTATPVAVKALITADVAANPGQVKSVFVLGHVPVPYSGNLNPDGHPDHQGAWPADLYYGELHGPWTDSTVNNTVASRPQNRNVPLDGKFDQTSLPSDVDLAVGRVDFFDLPAFAASELQLLEQYLDKDHAFRHQHFTAAAQCLIDDNFGWFSGEAFAASGWRNAYALLGPNSATSGDYFTTLNAAGPGYLWSYGCGGGWYQGASGVGTTADFAQSQCRTVFTMLFGSYFGDWDSTDNFLRAALAQGWTLANAWAGRPQWSFHSMGMGETIGYCARYSQNDTTAGGYGSRFVHIGLLGDPTLRLHVIAPPTQAQVADAWPQAVVSWTASADAVAGYHVYRSSTASGPFTRLTTAPVAGTSWTDPAPRRGAATYLVRAIRLETTPTGSYWNLSQGAFASADLPTAAAAHNAFGRGCYALSDSAYAAFGTPAAAAAGLMGRTLDLIPNSTGFTLSHGTATWQPPTGTAHALPLGDDDVVAVPLPAAMPWFGGSTSVLYVHSNGILAGSPVPQGTFGPQPSLATLLDNPAAAVFAWHDFDPSEPGSGPVLVEHLPGAVHVTFLGVESPPASAANPSWLQFQCDLATGAVAMVWGNVANNGSSPAPGGEGYLLGASPAGFSQDAGAIDLLIDLPLQVGNVNLAPLSLTATPDPIVTPTQGVTLTYALDHVPPLAPGQYLGALVWSLAPDLTGASLAHLGMPGCRQHLAALDLSALAFGTSTPLTATLALPAGFPRGVLLYAQGAAFTTPNSLPNGQNQLGVLTSNAIASFVNDR